MLPYVKRIHAAVKSRNVSTMHSPFAGWLHTPPLARHRGTTLNGNLPILGHMLSTVAFRNGHNFDTVAFSELTAFRGDLMM